MDQKEIDFELAIDQNSLDQEWLDQPRMYFRYAAQLADARQAYDAARADLDLTKAELDLAIRSDPQQFDLGKVTEASIQATILNQKAYTRARDKLSAAKHEVDVLEAAVGALDHRKRSLERLVELFLANYFSRPSAPNGTQEEVDQMAKRAIRARGRRSEHGG